MRVIDERGEISMIRWMTKVIRMKPFGNPSKPQYLPPKLPAKALKPPALTTLEFVLLL